MRRRRLWGIAVVSVTAALPVLVGLLWLRSYWPARFFLFSRDGHLTCVLAEGNRALDLADSENSPDRHLASLRADVRTRIAAAGVEFAAGPVPIASATGAAPMPATPAPLGSRGSVGGFGGVGVPGSAGPGGSVRRPRVTSGEFRVIGVSYAYPFTVSLVAAGAVVIAVRRRAARAAAGHCTHCGYDIRASPDRCPECGTSVLTAHSPS